MAVKVKTPYYQNFHIPQRCVACGAAPGPGMTWKVSGAKSNWSGKQTTTLSLNLPLCPECHTVSRDKGWAKFTSVMGVIFTILLCLIMAGLVGSGASENTFLVLIIGLVVIFGSVFLTVWLANTINQRGFTPEQRERRKTVKKCARITSFKAPGLFDKTGQIIFQFENELYASEFASINLGQPA